MDGWKIRWMNEYKEGVYRTSLFWFEATNSADHEPIVALKPLRNGNCFSPVFTAIYKAERTQDVYNLPRDSKVMCSEVNMSNSFLNLP